MFPPQIPRGLPGEYSLYWIVFLNARSVKLVQASFGGAWEGLTNDSDLCAKSNLESRQVPDIAINVSLTQ